MIILRDATPADARFIAQCIAWGVGDEITSGFAASTGHTVDDVKDLFARLAARTDSQYSYLNTIVAADDSDPSVPVGAIIAYDGARLAELREAFFNEAAERLGMKPHTIPDECAAEDYYLDTLAVEPAYRGRGIARMLIKAAAGRAAAIGKPAALLVDKENHRARRLYESVGFRQVTERLFAGELMDYLKLL